MPRQERLILYNPFAGGYRQKKVEALGETLGKAPVENFFDWSQSRELDQPPKELILFGGDGLVRRVFSSLLQKPDLEETPLLVVAGGGTGNTLRRMLVKSGATVSREELTDGAGFSKGKIIRPGELRSETDGGLPFVSVAGLGPFGEMWAKCMDLVRRPKLPSSVRLNLAGLGGVLANTFWAKNSEEVLDAFTTGPNLGFFPVSSQELTDGTLTRIRVDKNRKLILALLFWRFGHQPPESLVSVEVGDRFEVDGNKKTVNLDGGNFPLSGKELVVQRSERGIPVVALS